MTAVCIKKPTGSGTQKKQAASSEALQCSGLCNALPAISNFFPLAS